MRFLFSLERVGAAESVELPRACGLIVFVTTRNDDKIRNSLPVAKLFLSYRIL